MQGEGLSNTHIAHFVEELGAYLRTTSLSKEDCIRTTFAIEEALLHYQKQFGSQTPFTFNYGVKWGKSQFTLAIKGVAFNPFEVTKNTEDSDNAENTYLVMQKLLERMGLFPSWKYIWGSNVITMSIPKAPRSPLKKMGFAIASAFLIYGITLFLPESISSWIFTFSTSKKDYGTNCYCRAV